MFYKTAVERVEDHLPKFGGKKGEEPMNEAAEKMAKEVEQKKKEKEEKKEEEERQSKKQKTDDKKDEQNPGEIVSWHQKRKSSK